MRGIVKLLFVSLLCVVLCSCAGQNNAPDSADISSNQTSQSSCLASQSSVTEQSSKEQSSALQQTQSENTTQNTVDITEVLQSGYYTKEQVDSLIASAKTAISDNKNIRIVAGVVRNSGNGWEFIVDDKHSGDLNFIGIEQSEECVILKYPTATKVISLVAVSDETFAEQGITCGLSTGLDLAKLFIYKKNVLGASGVITCNRYGFKVNENSHGINGVSWNEQTGELTVSHAALNKPGDNSAWVPSAVSVTPRGEGVFIPHVTTAHSTTTIKFYDLSGEQIKTLSSRLSLNFSRIITNRIENVKVSPTSLVSKSGNFWIIGVFEV